jgi:hypothetical protein
VFFDCIGDLLLVYVPGRYIQLIDCGDEHDPCPNLFFTGSRFATLLPEQAVEDFPPFVMARAPPHSPPAPHLVSSIDDVDGGWLAGWLAGWRS